MSLSLAILVSGRGSNMAAILNAIKSGALAAKVEMVISNNPDAPALEIAREHGVKTAAVSHRGMSRAEHEQAILEILCGVKVDFIVLAGYMRVLTPKFLQAFQTESGHCRIINIHPSLLPAFPGACAYDEAFAANVRISGITVHLVDEQVDHGPILAQESFPRMPEDTLETFKARGLAVEHRLLPQVLQGISERGLELLPTEKHQTVTTVAEAKK